MIPICVRLRKSPFNQVEVTDDLDEHVSEVATTFAFLAV